MLEKFAELVVRKKHIVKKYLKKPCSCSLILQILVFILLSEMLVLNMLNHIIVLIIMLKSFVSSFEKKNSSPRFSITLFPREMTVDFEVLNVQIFGLFWVTIWCLSKGAE